MNKTENRNCGIHLTIDGECKPFKVDMHSGSAIGAGARAVVGGYIAAIFGEYEGIAFAILFDEEGGPKQLPVNEIAYSAQEALGMRSRFEKPLLWPLLGDVVIVGLEDTPEGREFAPLAPGLVALVETAVADAKAA